MTNAHSAVVSVRYMIDDVDAAVAFYTNHLGFILDVDAAPAFASVTRGNLRLLLRAVAGFPGRISSQSPSRAGCPAVAGD